MFITLTKRTLLLKTLYELYGYRGLFSQNLRYYVKNAKVDDNVIESIQEHPENFWYFNNGIILICEDYSIEDTAITLYKFSIINGGQTTKLIGVDGLASLIAFARLIVSLEIFNFVIIIVNSSLEY